MSVAVCRGPAGVSAFEAPRWLKPAEPYKAAEEVVVAGDDRPAQVDIWNAIQADVDKAAGAAKKASKPYVPPLVRRSSSLMSQKSLEVCTESLGSETGSGDFTASLDAAAADLACLLGQALPAAGVDAAPAEEFFWQQNAAALDCSEEQWGRKDQLVAVNYHCSGGTRSPRRSFPPPLPSMSRRDGPCVQMRPRRQDGRLVVEAVAVRPRGYLHARRQGGRLRLSFVDCSAREQSAGNKCAAAGTGAPYFPAVEAKNSELEKELAMEAEEDEEEVEVVDRGTVVEVKVSTQPQASAAAKVHRSTLVINKFVGSTPLSSESDQPRRHHATDAPCPEMESGDEAAAETEAPSLPPPTLRRVPSSTSTTTLAAAVAVASTATGAPPAAAGDDDDDDECGGLHPDPAAAADTKQLLLFTSRRGELLQSLHQCRHLRQLRQKQLFILEPYCIATS